MVGQSPNLGPMGRAQSSSSSAPVMMGQSCDLGPEGRVQSNGSFACCGILILDCGAQQRLGTLGASLTTGTASSLRRRRSSRNFRQFCQLGSALVTNVGVLGNKGCKHLWWVSLSGVLLLSFSPRGEISPRILLGAELLWTGGLGDTGKIFPMLCYVTILRF